MAPPTPLEYAPTPRRRFRIRFRWVALIALMAAALVGWRYGRQLKDQAKLRWTLHQCLTCSRGEDSVAYEANESFAKQLAANDPAYRLNFPSSTYGGFRGAYKPVDSWDALPA